MKNEKSDQNKRSAEDWVTLARHFGEECVKIQHDSQLTSNQKLEKQKNLSNKIVKEIHADAYLSAKDKKQMINSIDCYLDEWKSVDELAQNVSAQEKSTKKKNQ